MSARWEWGKLADDSAIIITKENRDGSGNCGVKLQIGDVCFRVVQGIEIKYLCRHCYGGWNYATKDEIKRETRKLETQTKKKMS